MFFTSPVPYGIILFLERFATSSFLHSKQEKEDNN